MMKRFKFWAVLTAAVTLASAAPVYAAGSPAAEIVETLTVEQALKAAISASNDLKNLDDSNANTDLTLEDLKQQYREAYEYNQLISLSTRIMQAEASQAQNNQNKKVTEDKLRISIMNFFASVISAQNGLSIFDKQLAIQKKQLDIAKVKNALGQLSKLDYDTQVNSYNQKTASRETQRIAIDSAFISLNKTMGTTLSKKYNLVLGLQYAPLGDVNLQGVIATSVTSDPSILTAQSNIDVAKYKYEHYDSSDTTTSKESLKISWDQTERALYETRRSVEQKVTNAYNTIQNQEAQYENTRLALEALMLQLPVKEKQLELGKITQLDLDKLSYDIAQQQESLRSLIINHEINVLSFKNPAVL